MDLDTFTIRARVRFPKLHFDGRYKLDTQILVLPINGEGTLAADAGKTDWIILNKLRVLGTFTSINEIR